MIRKSAQTLQQRRGLEARKISKLKKNTREKRKNEEKERWKCFRQHHTVEVEGRRHTVICLRHDIQHIVRVVDRVYGLL